MRGIFGQAGSEGEKVGEGGCKHWTGKGRRVAASTVGCPGDGDGAIGKSGKREWEREPGRAGEEDSAGGRGHGGDDDGGGSIGGDRGEIGARGGGGIGGGRDSSMESCGGGDSGGGGGRSSGAATLEGLYSFLFSNDG